MVLDPIFFTIYPIPFAIYPTLLLLGTICHSIVALGCSIVFMNIEQEVEGEEKLYKDDGYQQTTAVLEYLCQKNIHKRKSTYQIMRLNGGSAQGHHHT